MELGDEKVAIITGASRGIGAGLVEAYRKHGYRVVANSRTIDESPHPEAVSVAGDIAYAGMHPQNRIGTVSDIVHGVLYLETAPFVTGEILHVDGGVSAGH